MSARRGGKGEAPRASLWFWPAVTAAGSLVVPMLLLTIRLEPGTAWAAMVWPSGPETANTMLQAVATAVMTATTLSFSPTVVALQLTSQ